MKESSVLNVANEPARILFKPEP